MRVPSQALAGYVAMIVPMIFILFALLNVVRVSWRNWFGFGTKFKKTKKPPPTRSVPPRLRPRPDRE